MAQDPKQDEQFRQLTVQLLQLAVQAMQAEQNKKQAVPESLKLTYASLERLLYALLVPLGSLATYILGVFGSAPPVLFSLLCGGFGVIVLVWFSVFLKFADTMRLIKHYEEGKS